MVSSLNELSSGSRNFHLVKKIFGIGCKGLFFPEWFLKWFFELPSSKKALGHWFKGMVFSLNEFSNVHLNFHLIKKLLDIDCKNKVSALSKLSCVSSNFHNLRKLWDTDCMGKTFSWMNSQMFFKLLFSETALEYWFQGYGFFPQWILKWVFKLPTCEKTFHHWLHWYGFSPEWILECSFKLPFCEKSIRHWLQLYSIFPKSILKCFLWALIARV